MRAIKWVYDLEHILVLYNVEHSVLYGGKLTT
jgi:hypothetical protein